MQEKGAGEINISLALLLGSNGVSSETTVEVGCNQPTLVAARDKSVEKSLDVLLAGTGVGSQSENV